MKKDIKKKVKSTGLIWMLVLSVLLSFSITVSADMIDNEAYALIVPSGYSSWNDIDTTGHVEMGDTFNVTFNITINEQINSIGLDNVTFTQSIVNGTGTVVQGDALVAGTTTTWIVTDWSTNDGGYADPLATWAKTAGTNNSAGSICNTTWNARAVGTGYINFTDECGCSYGATDKPVNFHNGTVYVHPATLTGFTATPGSGEISLSWTKGAGADKTTIIGKQGSAPTSITDGTWTYNNTGTSTTHTGLGDGEHWYYMAMSWNNAEGWLSIGNMTDDATTTSNLPPTQTNPSPSNNSHNEEITLSQVSITLENPEGGNVLDWTIETYPNVGTSSGNNEANGSKTCSLSGLSYDTSYVWFVNVSDGNSWTNKSYNFDTRAENVPGIPGSFTATADGRFGIDLSWTKGSNADYTYIEWRATSGTWNRGDETELYNNTGTSTSQSGLNPSTTRYYQAWSYNTTDGTWSSSYATSHDTTDSNTAPVFGSESPTNGTGSQELSFSWSVPISDADGDTFNWTIECNNTQESHANGASNGTKSLSLSGLAYTTTYTVWVNATDSYDSVSEWFTFTTKDAPLNDHPTFGTPNPTNGSTDVSHSLSSWTIPINDPEGDNINWSIDTSPDIGSASQTGEGNGTKTCTLSGLSYSTTYTVYVNATDDGSGGWTNQTFWFETESSPNQHPNPPIDPDPSNNEPNVPVNVGEFSCLVTDPDGDSLDCSAYWANHTLIDTNNSVANNTVVHFDVGTLDLSTTYEWYVNVSDGEFTVQSPIWNFTTAANNPPVASFTVEYNNITRQVWMNDTSTDSDGNVVFWSWDFGDSSSVVHTQDAVHIYDTGGSFTIELTVIDNNGGTDSNSSSILLNYPPVASYIFTVSDMNITLNSTSTDSDGSIANYTLDWDDGNYSYTANATHEYTTEGTYLVNLTVTDNKGAMTSTWNAITVPPAPSSGFSFGEINWLVWGSIIAIILSGVFFIGMVWKR